MTLVISIRPERREDAPSIRSIVRRAFAEISYSDHREHLMVERLRTSQAYVPQLSLLAEAHGEGVGHVMLTKVTVSCGAGSGGLALAPLSVLPPFQRRGVGSRLVQEAHVTAKALDYGFIVLVGDPAYYMRFGYVPLDTTDLTIPIEVPAAYRMILALRPGGLQGLSGCVEYAPGWLDH